DAADPQQDAQLEAVETVLEEIDAADRPRLLVANKIDLLEGAAAMAGAESPEEGAALRVSARTGAGLESLRTAIVSALAGRAQGFLLHLPAEAGRLRSRLHQAGAVVEENGLPTGGWALRLYQPEEVLRRLCGEHGYALEGLLAVEH
ncbi:MAG: GTPase HflX, partial [Oceanococcaceae bacterium]